MISNRVADMLRDLFRGEQGQGEARMVGEVLGTDGDGTTWVHVLGGAERTPVSSTSVQLSNGDLVNLYVGDGRAEVVGNRSDPAPTTNQLTKVRKATAQASAIATEANEVASATSQHFWTDGGGVHVTLRQQEDWEESPEGPNTLINSLGQLLRIGLNNLVSYTQGATAFYDGLGNTAANIVARYGRDGAVVGYEDETHASVEPSRFGIMSGDDRIYEVKYEGELVSIYGGGTTHAAGTSYTNAYVEALCRRLNDGYTVDLDTMKVLLPNGLDSGMTVTLSSGDIYDVLDSDGEQFDSGSYAGILYGSTLELFSPNVVMTPAAEDKGAPIHEEMGGVALDFADSRMSVKGDTSLDGDLSVGGGMTVAGHDSPIGTLLTADETVSVSNNRGTAICSLTLGVGTWFVEGNVGFAENATGRRVVDLATGSGSVTDAVLRQTGNTTTAVSGGVTALHTTWTTARSSQTTIYLNAYQNSGAALSVTGYIRALRIQ